MHGIFWDYMGFYGISKILKMGSYKLSSVISKEDLQSFILALYYYKALAINPGQL